LSSRLSSVSLPRIGGASAQRVLRLRGDRAFLEFVREGATLAGALEIPSRETVEVGETVAVEISFGALHDEVLVHGQVAAVTERDLGQAALVRIEIDAHDASRMRYVLSVIEGERHASARGHRRWNSQLPVRWWWGLDAHGARLGDISKGGVFVVCAQDTPTVGAEVELELVTGVAPLRLRGSVTWVSMGPLRRGFGVCFKFHDRGQAEAVAEIVRAHSD